MADLTLDDIREEFLSNGRPCDRATEAEQFMALVRNYRLETSFRMACMKKFRTPHFKTLSSAQWRALTREYRSVLQRAIVQGIRPPSPGLETAAADNRETGIATGDTA